MSPTLFVHGAMETGRFLIQNSIYSSEMKSSSILELIETTPWCSPSSSKVRCAMTRSFWVGMTNSPLTNHQKCLLLRSACRYYSKIVPSRSCDKRWTTAVWEKWTQESRVFQKQCTQQPPTVVPLAQIALTVWCWLLEASPLLCGLLSIDVEIVTSTATPELFISPDVHRWTDPRCSLFCRAASIRALRVHSRKYKMLFRRAKSILALRAHSRRYVDTPRIFYFFTSIPMVAKAFTHYTILFRSSGSAVGTFFTVLSCNLIF